MKQISEIWRCLTACLTNQLGRSHVLLHTSRGNRLVQTSTSHLPTRPRHIASFTQPSYVNSPTSAPSWPSLVSSSAPSSTSFANRSSRSILTLSRHSQQAKHYRIPPLYQILQRCSPSRSLKPSPSRRVPSSSSTYVPPSPPRISLTDILVAQGLGDAGTSFVPFAKVLQQQHPHLRFVFPTAQTLPITLNSGYPMPAYVRLQIP
jgi:hypothetical protein